MLLAQNYESRRRQRDQSSVEIMSGYHASMNDMLEANNYVKMLLFNFPIKSKCRQRDFEYRNSTKSRNVQYGVTRVI